MLCSVLSLDPAKHLIEGVELFPLFGPFQQEAVTSVMKQESRAKVTITYLIGSLAQNSNLSPSNGS